jgi:hypothetical protein
LPYLKISLPLSLNMGSPLPVILCGKTLKIGQIVAPALGPEIEGMLGPQILNAALITLAEIMQLFTSSPRQKLGKSKSHAC